jgi:carboxyl-terminal processing protease
MRSMADGGELHRLGRTIHTFSAPAFALGSAEAQRANTRRFMIDFAEGDMAYYLNQPGAVEIVASATDGRVLRTFLVPNPAIKGYVLDLRNNGGGLLDAAIAVSDAFLERGEIVSQRGRKADQIQRYGARPGDLTGGLPLVVLINYGSASASEIVAGALKDHQRATIVGLTSFGKGSVQTVIPLRSGEDGALSITTARYFTPSGGSIQKIGIEPDLEVSRSLAEARIVSRSNFIYSEAAYATALDASIGTERKGPHTPLEAPGEDWPEDKDYQLERAFDVLRAGGDLTRLAAAPEGIVVTAPGSALAAAEPETAPENRRDMANGALGFLNRRSPL